MPGARDRVARSLAAVVVVAGLSACPVRTAPGPEAAAPASAAPAPAADAAPAGAVEVAGDKPVHTDAAMHVEADWIALRAERLAMDLATAQQRDAAFAAGPPVDGLWWDEPLAREVWGLWTELCVDCHGGTRSLAKVLKVPPPSRDWVETDALFFTRSRAPRSMFRVISEGAKSGKPDIKDMPAWQERISNEQIWGLVYFIKSASKKKGGDLH